MVIALSVAAICLWGTLVGSMLPLLFRKLGFDPGYASSPFVATFVDVTGHRDLLLDRPRLAAVAKRTSDKPDCDSSMPTRPAARARRTSAAPGSAP